MTNVTNSGSNDSGTSYSGVLNKMRVTVGHPARYELLFNEGVFDLSEAIGKTLHIKWSGKILCTHCGAKTNKSFNQGYCYTCFTKLAQCDSCMMSPEKCHFHLGTCRDPEWAEQVCFNDHIVYLANSSDVKVGITRIKNMPSRWFDQGATQALPIIKVNSRRLAGLVEDTLRRSIADKTNWRAMLKENAPDTDLHKLRDELLCEYSDEMASLKQQHGEHSIEILHSESIRQLSYPVDVFPTKVVSQSLDKTDHVQGRLMGIKGQYLMLDSGVFNVRKFTSYDITITLDTTEQNLLF